MIVEEIDERNIMLKTSAHSATVVLHDDTRWRVVTDQGMKTTFYTKEAAIAAAIAYITEGGKI